jgi:Domain of unknown function (DUF4157)/Lysine-specific metallo-endopeptidase
VISAPLQRKCACGNTAAESECEGCRQTRIQRKASRHGPVPTATGAAYSVAGAAGQPLDEQTRAFMESRFNFDLSRVRVHADGQAAQAARSVHAEAYTIGRDIVFGSGRYAPNTRGGQRLLAHELTHVVQQARGLRGDAATLSQAEVEATRNEHALHTSDALPVRAASPMLARKPDESTMEAPTAAPGCTPQQSQKIYPAADLARQWLDRSIQRLDAFVAAPADRANQPAREALQHHFRSTDPAIAGRVLERLRVVRSDIDSARAGDKFTVECHTNDDQTCKQSNAYASQNQLVFCPIFFTWNLESRAQSIVHEMMHTLGSELTITDRGYTTDRSLAVLNTPEALTNAESYGLLVRELGTNIVLPSQAPDDSYARNCRDVESLIRPAIARAQRWNRAGETRVVDAPAGIIQTQLGNDTPDIRKAAWDFYHRADSELKSPLDFVCDKQCGGPLAYGEQAADHTLAGLGIGAGIGLLGGLAIGGLVGLALGAVGAGLGIGAVIGLVVGGVAGAIGGSVASHGPRVHVCPGWKDQADENARIESILAAAYQALGRSQQDSVKYAKLAGALSAHYFPTPTLQDVDKGWLRVKLERVRARLKELREKYQRSSDEFAASVAADRERESLARGTKQLHSQSRSDVADRELWGGSFAGRRIRSAVTAAVSGNNVALNARIQVTYKLLSDSDGQKHFKDDSPRIAAAIRDVWQVTIENGQYAGVTMKLTPAITYLPPGAARDDTAFLIEVRGPDTDPSSGDAPSGIISLALAHLQGTRVIVVAHELAHLFGFVDTYLTMTQKSKSGRVEETLSVGRFDPRNRPDLLGDIDPVGLERALKKGQVTAADVARQTRPVHVWEEEATIVLRTLGVAPPAAARPTPDSENFDPDVELDRLRGEKEGELDRIRQKRERIEESIQSVDMAEEIIRLEDEERELNTQLNALP